MMKVTFDSNVWEKLVRGETEVHIEILKAINDGKIQPYLCQLAISIESITKKSRLNFFKEYVPKVEIEEKSLMNGNIRFTMSVSPNTECHTGLHEKLKESLELAKMVGFKVLPMTNYLTVRSPDIPEAMYLEDLDFWQYADKLSQCSDYIESLGCGSKKYKELKKLIRPWCNININEKEFSNAVAEWVDGDMLSAHYAYQNDFYCSEDKGKNAGRTSIMHSDNLNKLIEKFNIKVCGLNDLLGLI